MSKIYENLYKWLVCIHWKLPNYSISFVYELQKRIFIMIIMSKSDIKGGNNYGYEYTKIYGFYKNCWIW